MSMIHLIPAPAAFVVALGLAGAAFAQDDRCSVPMADWQPREAVRKMAEAQGWKVARIKIDDGCYEIHGFDAEGRRMDVEINPATLQILEFEFEDDEHGRKRNRGGESDEDND
ncbi:MAG: hypothetical protein ACD_54C01070G0001 [uncultured bacterium]|nr:MAG: hypothetical protein ACD_54C01070G0001 [uncultured bacterium]